MSNLKKDICIIGASCSFGKHISNKLQDYNLYTTNSQSLDVTQQDKVKNYFQKIGPIHGLVYCPALKSNADSFAPPEELQKLLDVNLFGAIFCLQSAIMMENSKIIVLGSTAGTFGNPNNCMYSVSKAALHQFVRCHASQLKGSKIQILCLAPGTIKTEEDKDNIAEFIKLFMDDKIKNIHGQIIRMDGGHHSFPV